MTTRFLPILFILTTGSAFCPTIKYAVPPNKHVALPATSFHTFQAPSLSMRRWLQTKSDETTEESHMEKSLKDTTTRRLDPLLSTEYPKIRRLKDLMWIRETLEDLTAAEFACSIEASVAPKRKRAVDYEKLLASLDRRIREMTQPIPNEDDTTADMANLVLSEKGMGSIVYSQQQRHDLLARIFKTRETLMEVMEGFQLDETKTDDDNDFSISLPELRVPKEDATYAGPKLYVRDDGTVDWDGALQDRAALKEFGAAVWARINGKDPETIEDEQDAASPKVTARIVDTPAIRAERERLEALQAELKDMENAHSRLLSSAIAAGQATANVNLASIEPGLRNRIRNSADTLEIMEQEVSFQSLNYELERIYTYLAAELGNPASKGYIPLQDRLNVAEFGLLESQIESFHRALEEGDTLDADVLAVLQDQVTDFKRRLGIDYYVTGLTFDGEAIKQWLGELWIKTKKGLGFYIKGVQLFWNDVVFAMRLIGRAAQGYTLKPREVRNLRRTFKDIVTFIPVVIILLIPLSPVGHVLVFGAIQRFFPDFFPSCFTEQRQNLLQLYESAEYSEFSLDENWREKLSRLGEALLFSMMTLFRGAYSKATGSRGESTETMASSGMAPDDRNSSQAASKK